MIPPEIAALLPATLTEIIATKADATKLAQAYEIALGKSVGRPSITPLLFVAGLVKEGMSRSEAGALYHAAQYWAQQGEILSQYPEGLGIDPRLAREIPATGPYAGEFGAVRYRVTVTLTDPATGEEIKRDVWITEPGSISREEVEALAQEKVADDMVPTLKGATGGEVPNWNMSSRIADFGQVL